MKNAAKTMEETSVDWLFCHTRYKATPIMAYNVIQTGAKIWFGGENAGLASSTYHERTD